MPKFRIYQLKPEHKDCLFFGWLKMIDICGDIKPQMYNELYSFEKSWDELDSASPNYPQIALEAIYGLFNDPDRPDDFHGHSLSVSDVVTIDGYAYYCDHIGWQDLTQWTYEGADD